MRGRREAFRKPRNGLGLLLMTCLSLGIASPVRAESSAGSPGEPASDSSGSARVSGLDREARLQQALDSYAQALTESGRDERLAGFSRAEQGFASLTADGVVSAALWTNLGNAALQAQHPGLAVLAYHRALRLEPDATAARQNLAHLRARLPSWVPRPDSSDGAQALRFYRQIGAETRSLVSAICFVSMSLCIVLAVRRREGAWRGLAFLTGLGWLIGVASLVYDGAVREDNLAVLIADEVLARSADSFLAPLALPDPLPAGVEVDLLEERAEWTRVRLANGRDVWVRSSSVDRVAG